MADLAAADLTYAAVGNPEMTGSSKVRRRFKITTAAGDYPTGGLPLTNAKLGCPTALDSLIILEPSLADNYQYLWDKSANKIKVVVDDAVSGIPAEHANAAFTSPSELIVEVLGY